MGSNGCCVCYLKTPHVGPFSLLPPSAPVHFLELHVVERETTVFFSHLKKWPRCFCARSEPGQRGCPNFLVQLLRQQRGVIREGGGLDLVRRKRNGSQNCGHTGDALWRTGEQLEELCKGSDACLRGTPLHTEVLGCLDLLCVHRLVRLGRIQMFPLACFSAFFSRST